MSIGGASLLIGLGVLDHYLRFRDDRRLAGRVRMTLQSERCRRCGGSLDEWDGRFGRLRALIDPGPTPAGQEIRWLRYQIEVKCQVCREEVDFMVWSDGKLLRWDDFIGNDLTS